METSGPRRRGKSAKSHNPEKGHSHLDKNITREDTITLDLSTTVTATGKTENINLSQKKEKVKGTSEPIKTTFIETLNIQAKNKQENGNRPSTTAEVYFDKEKEKSKSTFNFRRPQTSFKEESKQKWKPKLSSNINSELFSRTTFSISNAIDKMHLIIQDIDKEMKEEQLTHEQYQSQFIVLKGKKEDLEKKVKEDVEWLQNAESNLQAFKQSYSSLFNEMGKIKSL